MKAFPSECKWCEDIPYMKTGRIYLCKKHYRFQQMRVDAKRAGKVAPTYGQLQFYLDDCNMICPLCDREMNWVSKNGQSSVITLQHNNDGSMCFLCRACNAHHGKIGDIIYEINEGEKYCKKCDSIKNITAFYKDKSRPSGLKSSCKDCSNKAVIKYRNQNKEEYNEYQRNYRANN